MSRPVPERARRATAGLVLTPTGGLALVDTGDGPVEVVVPPVEATDADRVGWSAWAAAAVTAVTGVTGGVPLARFTVDVSAVLLAAVVDVRQPAPRVGAVRIVPRASTDPSLARSPADVVERVVAHRATVPGGHDLFGHELCPLDRDVLAEVCRTLQQSEVDAVAIVATGSQADPQHEREVADALSTTLPGAHISLASDYGGQGLIAREATVVLNGAMRIRAERVVDALEAALAEAAPGAGLRIARSDGGHATPSRLRSMPVMALGATAALRLTGAAHRAGYRDCRVVLAHADATGACEVGDVRHGLPIVRPARVDALGTELVVPAAAVSPLAGEPGDVGPGLDVPVVVERGDPTTLAALGALVSRPTSWLDEVGFIESAAELDRVRRDAEDRATAFATANGAEPGSGHLVEASVVAVPYSPSGTVRIRVRVAGDPDDRLPVGARR